LNCSEQHGRIAVSSQTLVGLRIINASVLISVAFVELWM